MVYYDIDDTAAKNVKGKDRAVDTDEKIEQLNSVSNTSFYDLMDY